MKPMRFLKRLKFDTAYLLATLFAPLAEFATYLENELYDHLFRNAAYTSPTTVYAALFDGTASTGLLEAGTLTGEIVGNGYARTAITFGAPTAGLGSNSAAVTFPAASGGNWGTITYMAIMDASTAGNVLMYTALDATVTINDGNQFQFNIGDIDADFKPASSEIATALSNELYDHVLRNAAYTSPTNVYLCMFTSTAVESELEASTFTNEVGASRGYTRIALTVTAPTDGAGSNSGDHTFNVAVTTNWGTLRWVAIVDNSTLGAGVVLVYTSLDSDVVINIGNTLQFNNGDLDIQIQ
jgi:hypothetical protein